jgi:hypothetical protein
MPLDAAYVGWDKIRDHVKTPDGQAQVYPPIET